MNYTASPHGQNLYQQSVQENQHQPFEQVEPCQIQSPSPAIIQTDKTEKTSISRVMQEIISELPDNTSVAITTIEKDKIKKIRVIKEVEEKTTFSKARAIAKDIMMISACGAFIYWVLRK